MTLKKTSDFIEAENLDLDLDNMGNLDSLDLNILEDDDLDLENDDEIKTEEGWKEIESIDIDLNSEPLDLYTISVEGLDNFYANGSLMHDNEF